MNSTGQGI